MPEGIEVYLSQEAVTTTNGSGSLTESREHVILGRDFSAPLESGERELSSDIRVGMHRFILRV